VHAVPTALAWSLVPALLLFAIVWWIDRYEKEPLRLLAVGVGLGAFAAPAAAALFEWAFGIRSSLYASDLIPHSQLTVWTPVIEEICRGLAVLAVVLLVRREVDDLLDGLVYGAAVGIGFGLAAEFVSIVRTPALSGDRVPSLYAATIAGTNHLFYGAVIGVAVAAARRRALSRLLAALAVGIAVAATVHVLHDYAPWWAASSGGDSGTASWLARYLPNALGLLALAVLMAWCLARERLVIEQELSEEAAAGVVTRREYAAVTNGFRRAGELLSVLVTRGPAAWLALRRLYLLEVELAFRKHHRRTEKARGRRFLDEDLYRRRIAETRRLLTGETTPEPAA
jgi:RsiW-degrading membrane proteinase PrsW (M82 family)